jgi:hypothetical protein
MANILWWIRNILHLETLFIIGVAILLIYYIWFAKDKNVEGLNKILFSIKGGGDYHPERPKRGPKKNKHEERCREIFEEIFDCKFKSVRPDWLKNPVTNKNLELDGYNEEIETPLGEGLAFEYDGAQHSRYSKHFHKNGPDEFVYQTKKDSWKDLRCKDEGVMLIRIPDFVAFQDLERYIKQKLRRNGLGDYLDS